MTTNHNPDSGIAYGFISAQKLDSELVNDLQFGSQATEPYYEEAWQERVAEMRQNFDAEQEEARAAALEDGRDFVADDFDEEDYRDSFNDDWQPDEPIHEGVKDGVKYSTSWFGGALHVWVFESPVITNKARRASPCVPGAAILDTLDGSETGYDVPWDWRDPRDCWQYRITCQGSKLGAIGLSADVSADFQAPYPLDTYDERLVAGLNALRGAGLEWVPGVTKVELLYGPDMPMGG